ncbi:hypothetical protein L5515_011243 [Caenorhabditis briggsae]|uniref:Chromo domain-containing protein n=1 Tax=Caenorhabditis briggsae TaxID=6238 RepID=A0AAE9EVV1_CAEBR|nr:hypothetical protein L5515_011243 [Caenorhabditis briggsae]
MTKRSAPTTPSRSAAREPRKAPVFHTDNDTPKSSGGARTPLRTSANYKVIIGHRVYDEFYVEYEVELHNGKKVKATEFDLRKNPKMLAAYKKKVTNQDDDSVGECVVEKVLTHRKVDGKPLYLVQWKGYPHPVWRSEMWTEDLSNCKNLLKEYHYQLEQSVAEEQTPLKSAQKSAKKRAMPSSSAEAEKIKATETTPRKPAKQPNLGSARNSKARSSQMVVRSEEVQDEDDVRADDQTEHEKNIADVGNQGEQQDTSGLRWLMNPFRWF